MPLPTPHPFLSWVLILVVDETSGRILGAELVPQPWAEGEFNRLIDHFQFGAEDYDSLKPVSQVFALRLKRFLPNSSSERIRSLTEPHLHRLLICRRADLP